MNNNFIYDNYAYPNENRNMLIKNQILPVQNNKMTNNNFMQPSNLAEPYQGYIQGNMFNDLYKGYKNYRPARLVPNNEQAELLLNLNQLTFAAHDLNLYLDVFPNNHQMIQLFNKYQMMTKEAMQRYESKYGPIQITTQSDQNNFSWEAYSWPWEVE